MPSSDRRFNMISDGHTHISEINDSSLLLKETESFDLMIESAYDPLGFERCVSFAEEHENVYCTVGVHPQFALRYDNGTARKIESLLAGRKVAGIGEIGLDKTFPFYEVQKTVFAAQLTLASLHDVPVVLHTRRAFDDTFEALKTIRPGKALFHGFSGSTETAKRILSGGFFIGIGHIVLLKNSVKIKEALKYIPLDKIILETDGKAIGPDERKLSSSAMILNIAEIVSGIKDISTDNVLDTSYNNLKTFFDIKES